MPWTTETIAGHPCDLYLPPERSKHGYVVLYLHGVHLNRLDDKPAFIAQFDRHGLAVVCPHTQRSWWTDKICNEFDRTITAEQHVLKNVLPFIGERLGAQPPRIGLLGTSMGGQGALRLAYKHPNLFPVAAAISPAIDFHKRYNEGDETIPQMYPDPEAARQDTATLWIHPLNWPRHQFFCCDPADLPLARKRRPPADEALVARRPARLRSRNHRRRPRLRVLQPHGRAGDQLPGREARRRAAANRLGHVRQTYAAETISSSSIAT